MSHSRGRGSRPVSCCCLSLRKSINSMHFLVYSSVNINFPFMKFYVTEYLKLTQKSQKILYILLRHLSVCLFFVLETVAFTQTLSASKDVAEVCFWGWFASSKTKK